MSDWIEHDGARPAFNFANQMIHLRYQLPGLPPPLAPDVIPSTWPGWFWRWKPVKTGIFTSELRRVCDDPAYAPIVAYRFQDEGEGEAKTAFHALLEAIKRDPFSVVIPDDQPSKVTASGEAGR